MGDVDGAEDFKDIESTSPAAASIAPPIGAQKRPLSDRGGPASKKAHMAEMSEEIVQVKVLIPGIAVGAIIGKGGETMRNLKNETGCRVQMSKNQDVYPGTNERICLVKGKVASAMRVMETIMEKIREKVDASCPIDNFDHKGVERNKEMKILVPNTSAGMVIGKSGARIKEIRDVTGANIQVYPKAGSQEAKVSLERVITIAADSNAILMNAIQRVLEKVAADPMHAQDLDSSKHGDGQSAGSFPSGNSQSFSNQFDLGRSGQSFMQSSQPFASSQPPTVFASQSSMQPPRGMDQYGSGGKEMYTNGGGNSGYKFNPMQGLGNNELLAFLDSLQSTLRSSGFNEISVGEVMQAMQVLAKYNIMGLGLGLGVAAMAQMRTNEPPPMPPQQSPQQPPPGMPPQPPPQRYDLSSQPGGPMMHESGGHMMHESGDRSAMYADYNRGMGPSEHLGGVGGVLIDVMSKTGGGGGNPQQNNFAATVIKERPQIDPGCLELEVPDAIVGAVLGQKAKTLQDIQHFSGCKVEVHKRGSQSSQGVRLITLSGNAEHVRAGRVMIEKVINDEQSRRSNQQHHTRSGFI